MSKPPIPSPRVERDRDTVVMSEKAIRRSRELLEKTAPLLSRAPDKARAPDDSRET